MLVQLHQIVIIIVILVKLMIKIIISKIIIFQVNQTLNLINIIFKIKISVAKV